MNLDAALAAIAGIDGAGWISGSGSRSRQTSQSGNTGSVMGGWPHSWTGRASMRWS